MAFGLVFPTPGFQICISRAWLGMACGVNCFVVMED